MSRLQEEVIDFIRGLPDDCTMEDIQYHLFVRSQVQKGIEDIDAGRVVSQDEAMRRLERWQTSSGQETAQTKLTRPSRGFGAGRPRRQLAWPLGLVPLPSE